MSGINVPLDGSWASITSYATGQGNRFAKGLTNKWIEISGNTIDDASQACITISNSANVQVVGNNCNRTNVVNSSYGAINVLSSRDVSISKNKRSGASRGIFVDGPTSTRIQGQTDF
jgi:hypothetical protein